MGPFQALASGNAVIRVVSVPAPPGFDTKVREPGLRAIAEMVGSSPPFPRGKGQGSPFKRIAERREDIPSKKFPTYWRRIFEELMDAYDGVCAYACFRIHPVTGARSVDHMAPKSRAWNQIYEWNNYRLACSLLNARKRDFGDILDPFEIHDRWFELEFNGFQLRPCEDLNHGTTIQIVSTIRRLGLNDRQFRTAREHDWENYTTGRISFEILVEESPLVAREGRRQGLLRR